MRHHVHGTDAEHRAVHIKTVEHVIHIMILVLPVKENFFLSVLFKIFAGCHQEAGSAAGRITDHFVRRRFHQIDHHTDDMSWRTELSVHSGCGKLGKQVLVNVATDIRRFHLCHLGVQSIHGSDDLIQHQRCRDFEDRVSHIFGISAVFIAMQIFYERKYPFLNHAVHFCCRKVMEDAPFQLVPGNRPVADLYLFRKNTLIWKTQHGGFLCAEIIRVIQIMDEHHIGHLFNDIQRIGKPAGPEYFPNAVDFVFQFACNHWCSSS